MTNESILLICLIPCAVALFVCLFLIFKLQKMGAEIEILRKSALRTERNLSREIRERKSDNQEMFDFIVMKEMINSIELPEMFKGGESQNN